MSEKNRIAREQLEMLYDARCMLTLCERCLTFHHIEKAQHGGEATVENGALLNDKIHSWLTNLEYKDPELYDLINECLVLYKICMDEQKSELVQLYREECVPEFQKKMGMRYNQKPVFNNNQK
jgi:hypothetical protein